jgi:lysophospholipase L1-like esterase
LRFALPDVSAIEGHGSPNPPRCRAASRIIAAMRIPGRCVAARTVAALACVAILADAAPGDAPPVVQVRTAPAPGIGREAGVVRRDPSDVLRAGGRHLVLYTKVTHGAPTYPAGYGGTVWYATSDDGGRTWTERGEVVGRGRPGRFDEAATFTPNAVLDADGSLLVFYTGVAAGFDNRPDDYAPHNRTAIGVARAFLDESGGLASVERLNGGAPVLEAAPADSGRFDAFRVDDAAIVRRDGRWWLYYKGRAHRGTPRETKMGVAVADAPEGPYRKLGDGPVQPEGHEVLVWPQEGVVASLVTNAGRGLYVAPDGVHFTKVADRIDGRLRAPGAHRIDLSRPEQTGPIRWGIHMGTYAGEPFLERFEIDLPDLPPRTVLPVPSAEDRAAAAGWRGGGAWIDQHRDIVRACGAHPCRVLLLGDSITQSWGGPGRDVWGPGRPAWDAHLARFDAVNGGISGDRTEHLLWRLDHGLAEAASPEAVVVMIGTNNLPRDPAAGIARGVAAVVDRIHVAWPAARVLLVEVPPRGERPDDPLRVKGDEVNRLIAPLGEQAHVRVLPVGDLLLNADGRSDPQRMSGDHVHLAPGGYAALGARLAAALGATDR